MSTSQAEDAGENDGATVFGGPTLTYDQREAPFARTYDQTSGGAINYSDGTDVGAFELQPITVVYADTHWIGLATGTYIPDADPVTAGAQPASVGINAFGSVDSAITAVATGGEVIVNGYNGDSGSGDFAEDVTVDKNVTLHLQEGLVTFNSLEGNNSTRHG